MKAIKNLRELHLMKEKLEYQERLYEKEMAASTADIIDNLTDKLRDMAFDVGTRLVVQLITSWRKHEPRDDKEEEEKT
jgi:hypothetical protein